MTYKLCKLCENRARDTPLRGVYIPHFGKIWVKISVFGVLHPCCRTDGGEIWHGGREFWYPLPCQISPPSVPRVAPAGRKTSKSASEYIKYQRLALRAMLPVKIAISRQRFHQSPPSLALRHTLILHTLTAVKTSNFLKFKTADGRRVENKKIRISNTDLTERHKIEYWSSAPCRLLKVVTFKIQVGGWLPSWK